jgi:hypothetical protein
MEPDARANQLYWESDQSVNQIADTMELSKGMLYGMIRPLPAGLPCPRCSSDLEYANRTARERGLITCRSCALELDEKQARSTWEAAAAATPGDEPLVTPRHDPYARGGFGPDKRDPVLVGAGLLLIAAGIWLFRGLNRR